MLFRVHPVGGPPGDIELLRGGVPVAVPQRHADTQAHALPVVSIFDDDSLDLGENVAFLCGSALRAALPRDAAGQDALGEHRRIYVGLVAGWYVVAVPHDPLFVTGSKAQRWLVVVMSWAVGTPLPVASLSAVQRRSYVPGDTTLSGEVAWLIARHGDQATRVCAVDPDTCSRFAT